MQTVTINANQLRWLAEEADGKREEDLVLCVKDGKLVLSPKAGASKDSAVIEVKTPLEGEGGMRATGRFGVTYDGHPIDIGTADAVFFTQSAVEKFVLTYYMRMWRPGKIHDLKMNLYRPGILMTIHDPPSITSGVGEGSVDDPWEFKGIPLPGMS